MSASKVAVATRGAERRGAGDGWPSAGSACAFAGWASRRSISDLNSANALAPFSAARVLTRELPGSVRPRKNAGVPVTPALRASSMSLRISRTNLPPLMHCSNRPASSPMAWACVAHGSRVFWFSKRRSCISQYFPCSPAQRAASAALKARLWMLSRGMSRKTDFSLPVLMYSASICGYVSRTYLAQNGH